MMGGAQIAVLPDGRLHLNEGPIDLIVEAKGPGSAVKNAYEKAAGRFVGLLSGLVEELSELRTDIDVLEGPLKGPVAGRMEQAVRRHRGQFVTPMAAVAGAVADEILSTMKEDGRLRRAYVNNGGDIALHLAPGESFAVGVVIDAAEGAPRGRLMIHSHHQVRGLATSGWRGRSFSLGIADAVTVLAESAAAADVAATLIANAVDVDHPAVSRRAASDLDPDSDLKDRAVTVAVGWVESEVAEQALSKGARTAEAMIADGTIHGAVLCLQDSHRIVGRDRPTYGMIAA